MLSSASTTTLPRFPSVSCMLTQVLSAEDSGISTTFVEVRLIIGVPLFLTAAGVFLTGFAGRLTDLMNDGWKRVIGKFDYLAIHVVLILFVCFSPWTVLALSSRARILDIGLWRGDHWLSLNTAITINKG